MNAERWERIQELFHQASDLSRSEREAFVAQACAGDLELRDEVLRMLAKADVPTALEPPAPRAERGAGQGARFEGWVLDDFELVEEIGRGATGVVYRARQRSLDREVAVKVLPVGPATSQREIDRFHREARAAGRVKHPGIVPIYSDGHSVGAHYFAMEFVPGGDLESELELQRKPSIAGRQPRLPGRGDHEHVPCAARIVADAAEALQHAHENGIVHRDIKPRNLLIGADGRARLVDFGLARDDHQGSISQSGDVAGTPHYMSPEQVRAERGRVDHRTDVYSLGVVLFELLTLQRPFDGATVAEVLNAIVQREPKQLRRLNPKVPRDLAVICQRAMARDPRERYPSAGEFAADLRRFLRFEAIHARPPGLRQRLTRWAWRRRRALVGAAAIALAAWVSALAAGRRAVWLERPEVRIALAEGEAASGTWTATVRWLDLVTGEVGAAEPLGDLPVKRRFAPGLARFVVRGPGGRTFEFTRLLRENGAPAAIAVDPRSAERVQGEMVQIDAVVLDYPPAEGPSLSTLAGRRIAVEPFLLDRFEVSVAEYARFLEETGTPAPPRWELIAHLAEHPAAEMSWEEAQAYAEWAGKRLPTVPELAAAGRGAAGRAFPYDGDDWRGAVHGAAPRAGMIEDLVEGYITSSAPVRSMPEAASAAGVHHLLGNVREWTENLGIVLEAGKLVPEYETRQHYGSDWAARERGTTLDWSVISRSGRSGASLTTGFRCSRSLDSH